MTGSHEVTGSIPVGSTTPSTASADLAIHLFEDEAPAALRPLLRLRPACELRSGALSLRERCEMSGVPLQISTREELRELSALALGNGESELSAERWLSINARARFDFAGVEQLIERARREDFALRCDGVLVARAASSIDLSARDGEPLENMLWNAGWELIHEIDQQIRADFELLRVRSGHRLRSVSLLPETSASYLENFDEPFLPGDARIDPGAHLLGAENVLLGRGVRLQPGVVLDAEAGPILIGAGARIAANSTIVGPAVIGPAARIHPGSKLREGCVIGALCRVGGEIEESILLEASNKQHDGFLGHALLGSWVNLGANTTVSDLKNNYGVVRVDFGEGPFESGERFVGPMIADHTKTAIGTLLGTGSVIDVGCNVFGSGFPPRYLRPYSWGGAEALERARLDETLATMRTVISRREALLVPPMEALLRAIHASC